MAMRSLERPTGDYDPGFASGTENGDGISSDPKQMASQVMDQAKEKAGQAAETARDVVKGQVQSKTSQAGGQVSTIAQDLRRAAASLRAEGSQTFIAELAERAAGSVEQAAGYLDNADLETIIEDLKRAGRQRPLAVAGGLFALGFAASRLIKASTATEEE